LESLTMMGRGFLPMMSTRVMTQIRKE